MKGVAIQYIIAILLGIVVIGLIGYWLFTSTGKIGGAATTHDCKQKQLTLCTEWLQIGFDGATDDNSEMTDTKVKGYDDWKKNCGPLLSSISRGTCKTLLGLS